jgi:hypothetical protein
MRPLYVWGLIVILAIGVRDLWRFLTRPPKPPAKIIPFRMDTFTTEVGWAWEVPKRTSEFDYEIEANVGTTKHPIWVPFTKGTTQSNTIILDATDDIEPKKEYRLRVRSVRLL